MEYLGNLDEINSNDEMKKFVDEQVEKISKTSNVNGRSLERIKNDAKIGISAEYFLMKKYNLNKSDDWRFDLYDSKYNYEVKTARLTDNFKYFPIRQDLKYVYENKDIINYVFLCCVYPNNDVYLFKKLEVNEFLKNVRKSKFNNFNYLAKYLIKE
jgi:hypothetical protein